MSGMDIHQILQFLPHRYPFLLVDRVISYEVGKNIVALKNVTMNEPYFPGHFPGHPIMPGVLQLEAMAQVAGILMMRQAENAGKLAYFMSAENVKWRRPVRPGDVLHIDVELTKMRGKIGIKPAFTEVRDVMRRLRPEMRLDDVKKRFSGAVGANGNLHLSSPGVSGTVLIRERHPPATRPRPR
mgnify:CR=1 FL=1